MKTFRDLRDKDGTLEQLEVRSPEEQGLVRRLDIFLMVFGCISQGLDLISHVALDRADTCDAVIKYLDQQNIVSISLSSI